MNSALESLQADRSTENLQRYTESKEAYFSTPDGLRHLAKTQPEMVDHYKQIRQQQLDQYQLTFGMPSLLTRLRSEAGTLDLPQESSAQVPEVTPVFTEESQGKKYIWFNGDENIDRNVTNNFGDPVYHYYRYKLAPSDAETGVQCERCDEYLSAEGLATWDTQHYTCDKCKSKVWVDYGFDANLALNSQAIDCIDKAKVRERKWYHTSVVDGLDENIKDDQKIYCGTDLAATMRAAALHKTKKPVHIYELTLKDDAPIDDYIYHDDNGFIGEAGGSGFTHKTHQESDPDKVSRYVNYYEDAGSISLFGSAQLFNIRQVS